MNHKVAVAQFEIKIGSPDVNIDKGLAFIDQAIQKNAQLILLPELWTSGYDLDKCDRYIHLNQQILVELHSCANQNNIVIGGSYITQDRNGFKNSFLLIEPGEQTETTYHKVHLFRLLKETQYFVPGSDVVLKDTPLGRVGLAICYDVRFPELFRAYCREHVEIILVSAEWGIQRDEHWRTLLRARAIENQAFVIAANAVGPLFETQCAGYSAVIDPWGVVLAEAGSSEERLLMAEIDTDEIKIAEHKLASREDARNEIYAKWLRP